MSIFQGCAWIPASADSCPKAAISGQGFPHALSFQEDEPIRGKDLRGLPAHRHVEDRASVESRDSAWWPTGYLTPAPGNGWDGARCKKNGRWQLMLPLPFSFIT